MNKINSKPILFVSHVHEDAEIAKKIQQWLNDKLAKSINVFVSSDKKESMPGGTSWWDEIRSNLTKSQLLVAIITKRSKNRSWIYFEVGGAYFQKINVLPILIGVPKNEINSPLSQITYYDFSNEEDFNFFCNKILKEYDLATELSDLNILKNIISMDERIQQKFSIHVEEKKQYRFNKNQYEDITPFSKAEEKQFAFFEKTFKRELTLEVDIIEDNFETLLLLTREIHYYYLSLLDLLTELVKECSLGKKIINITRNIDGLKLNDIIYVNISDFIHEELKRKKYRISSVVLKDFPYADLRGAKLITMPNDNSMVLSDKMFRFYYWLKFKEVIKSQMDFKLIKKEEHNWKTKP